MTPANDPIELFCWVCEKPGMYVHSGRFDTVWSFIDGYDWGCDHEPLRGFREWLSLSRDRWTNIPWYMLVRERLYPGTDPGQIPSDDEHVPLLQETVRLLREFKAVRDEVGVANILADYDARQTRADERNGRSPRSD